MKIFHHHLQIVDSTNNWAKKDKHFINKDEFHVFSASEQTGGRGQYGRIWLSPAHQNLYVSFSFIASSTIKPFQFTQLLAISVCDYLLLLGLKPQIKFPNDVLIERKKIAGILCETLLLEQGELLYVIGLGFNINMRKEQLDLIDQPATSLYVLLGEKQPIDAVLEQIKEIFLSHLMLFLTHDFSLFEPKLNLFSLQ